jgi:tetratricopeptide (TPR) repeat protein
MRLTTVLASLLAVSASMGAPEPLSRPVPLAPPPSSTSPGEVVLAVDSAERAQALGFPSTAVSLYRSMLAGPGADSRRLTLALASALLDDGDVAGAGRVLEAYTGPRGAGWHLRAGLVAAYNRRFDQAKSDLAAAHPDELDAVERGWHPFLEGMIADAGGEPLRAAALYQQAASDAVNSLQRARYLLAAEQVRLRMGSVTEAQLDPDQKNAEAYQYQKIGYGFSREYAIALNSLGRTQKAIDVLQAELRILPAEERSETDHFRLLLGLIAGAGAGVGRQELFELLESGGDPDRQRIALQLLVRSSESGALRTELGDRLDRLIAAPKPHPILESLLLCRAQLGLAEAHMGLNESADLYARAEDDAHALLDKFPGSSLKAQAFAVLASSAWEQNRYRTAADYASKAGAELAPGPERAQFEVLVAEAWFRAGLQGKDAADFRNAADAYAAALRSRPAGVRPSLLMFQRAQSDIEAGALSAAASVIDELSRDPSFDPVDRWESEWNLARALEVRGDTAEAYGRVSRLLGGPVPDSLGADLRARMEWLQARLAFDSKKPLETIRLLDSLLAETGGLSPDLRTGIASTGELLKAEAQFAMMRDSAAQETLGKLRAEFPKSESTVYSYIVEANRFAQQDRVVDAQRLLTKLADDFPDDVTYAPYALYQAALQAERLGTDNNLNEAYRLLEGLVTNKKYSSSPLIFPARMREGDILRELNQFPQAQQVYESLVNNPASSQNADDVILAQLALAECHEAQSADNSSHADSAVRIFEDIFERVDATPDERVEAGYNLGKVLERSDAAKAQEVWWNDVVDAFLVKPGGPGGLGAKGRWWIARTLLDVGRLYENEGRLDDAKRAWTLWVDSGLPDAAIARERLARFNLPAAKT